MTDETVLNISILKEHIEQANEDIEVFRAAIKALEQGPCDDAINRQAVLDLLDDAKKQGIKQITVPYFKCLVENLPPVNPQPKTGKWMETDSADPYWYMCSECHRRVDDKESYCPSCGAIMQESEEV